MMNDARAIPVFARRKRLSDISCQTFVTHSGKLTAPTIEKITRACLPGAAEPSTRNSGPVRVQRLPDGVQWAPAECSGWVTGYSRAGATSSTTETVCSPSGTDSSVMGAACCPSLTSDTAAGVACSVHLTSGSVPVAADSVPVTDVDPSLAGHIALLTGGSALLIGCELRVTSASGVLTRDSEWVTSYSVPGTISSANLTPGSAFGATCSLELSALHGLHCTGAVVTAPGREGCQNDQRGGRQRGQQSNGRVSPHGDDHAWRWRRQSLLLIPSPDPTVLEPTPGAPTESTRFRSQ